MQYKVKEQANFELLVNYIPSQKCDDYTNQLEIYDNQPNFMNYEILILQLPGHSPPVY